MLKIDVDTGPWCGEATKTQKFEVFISHESGKSVFSELPPHFFDPERRRRLGSIIVVDRFGVLATESFSPFGVLTSKAYAAYKRYGPQEQRIQIPMCIELRVMDILLGEMSGDTRFKIPQKHGSSPGRRAMYMQYGYELDDVDVVMTTIQAHRDRIQTALNALQQPT